MKASELRPGQWFERNGNRRLCVGQKDGWTAYVVKGSQFVTQMAPILEVTPLNVHSWDDEPQSVKPAPLQLREGAWEEVLMSIHLKDGAVVEFDSRKFVLLVQMQGKTDCKSFDNKWDAEKFGVDMLSRHDKRVFLSDECWMCCGVDCGSPGEVLEEWQSQLSEGERFEVIEVVHNAKMQDADIAEVPPPVEPAPRISAISCQYMDHCDCMSRMWIGKCPHAKEPLPTIDTDKLAETYEAWLKEQKPQPDADGWIAWNGGECPVENPETTFIQVQYCSGGYGMGYAAGFDWQHLSNSPKADIVRFQVYKPQPAPITHWVEVVGL